MIISNILKKSELERNRIDAEYHDPKYSILKKTRLLNDWKQISNFLQRCKYGCSIKMNTNGIGHKIFRMDNISNGFVLDEVMKFATLSTHDFQKFKLEKNDILFNRVNSEEFVGRTGIFKLDGQYMFASYLIQLRTNSSMNPNYLNVFLNSKYGKMSIKQLSRRAVNQSNVNAKELRSIFTPVPPITFQNKISRVCDKAWNNYYAAKIKFTASQKTLDRELKIELLDHSHIETYHYNIKKIIQDRRLDAEYHQTRYESLLDKIKEYKFGYSYLTDIVTISTSKMKPQQYLNRRFMYIELADIDEFGLIDSEFIDGRNAPSRARMILREGNIIASTIKGSLSKIALVSNKYDRSIGSTGFFVFKPIISQNGYVFALLKNPIVQLQLEKESSGTILSSVHKESIHKIITPNIPLEKCNAINKAVHESLALFEKSRSLFNSAVKLVDEYIDIQINAST